MNRIIALIVSGTLLAASPATISSVEAKPPVAGGGGVNIPPGPVPTPPKRIPKAPAPEAGQNVLNVPCKANNSNEFFSAEATAPRAMKKGDEIYYEIQTVPGPGLVKGTITLQAPVADGGKISLTQGEGRGVHCLAYTPY